MMKEYLNIIKEDDCIGCGACYNKCPVGAIAIEYNEEGFYTPFVNRDKCINCDLCKKVCPKINVKYNNDKLPKCFAVMANDEIRMKSSSGGMFTLLAEYVLEKGGYVCGAAFNKNDWSVEHIIIDKIEDLDLLRKSKYVQSNTKDCYKETEKLLKQGNYVLFSGTPCQIAGLKCFLGGEEYEKLITVDLVCHGVPSSKVFNSFLNEFGDKNDIKSIDFREKEIFGWTTSTTIKFKTKDTYRKWFKFCNYFKGFQYNLFLKQHCTRCQYSKLPRQGDITLGDFWGIGRFDKNLRDGKGTGLVVFNSAIGYKYLNIVRDKLRLFKEIPLDFTVQKSNPNLNGSFKEHKNRKVFFEYYNGENYTEAFKYGFEEKFDTVIVNDFTEDIFGETLNILSMDNVLKKMNNRTLVVNKNNKIKDFDKKYFNMFEMSKDNIFDVNEKSNKFILIGNESCFAENTEDYYNFTFLQNIKDCKTKIGYGLSFGKSNAGLNQIDKSKMTYVLSRFSNIFYKDDYNLKIFNELNINASRVLNPILLSDDTLYKSLLANDFTIDDNKVFCYLLKNNKEQKKIINQIFDENKNLKMSKVNDNDTLKEFLNNFISSKYVITDSYNIICLSLLFKKNFIAVSNDIKYVTGIESLLNEFQLSNKLIYTQETYNANKKTIFNDIDYISIQEFINNERENSIKLLKQCLNSEVGQDFSTFYDYNIMSEYQTKIKQEKVKKYQKRKLIYFLKYQFYRIMKNFVPRNLREKYSVKKEKYKNILRLIS